MPKYIRNNFTSGEVSPALRLRNDLALFTSGLKTCKNVVVTPEGGVKSRAGSQVTYVMGSSDYSQSRVFPFIFSNDMAFQVLVSPTAIVVFYRGQPVQGALFNSSSEGWPGYSWADIQDLKYTQTLDVMIFTVEGSRPWALRRVANDSWELTDDVWRTKALGPVSMASTGLLLTNIVYDPANRTMTAHSGYGSEADYTGRRIYMYDPDESSVFNKYDWDFVVETATNASSGVDLTLRQLSTTGPDTAEEVPSSGAAEMLDAQTTGESDSAGTYKKDYYYRVTAVLMDGRETPPGAIVTARQIKTLTTVWGLKFSWNPWTGKAGERVIYYRVYKETAPLSGIFGWIGDVSGTTYTDFNIAPLASDTISATEGLAVPKASAVALYQQRLVLGGGGEVPGQILASRTGDYFSTKASSPIKDTDAFSFALSSPAYERIRSMVSLDRLYIFTSEGVWALGEGVNEVLTPFTFSAKKLSYEGASSVPPVVVGSQILYVPTKRDRLLLATFGGTEGQSSREDLTVLCRHLFRGHQITEVVRRLSGEYWVLLDTGALLTLTYLPEHKIVAWSRVEMGAGALTISLTATPELGGTAVYALIRRYGVYTMERLTPPTFNEAAPSMDAWVTGVRASSVEGLSHLEGVQVAIVADGVPLERQVVTNGRVILDKEAKSILVGVPFETEIETFPLFPETNDIGQRGQLVKVRAHLMDEAPVKIEIGGEEGYYPARSSDDGYGAPTVGDVQDVDIPAGWHDGIAIRVTTDQGAPLQLLALELQIEY